MNDAKNDKLLRKSDVLKAKFDLVLWIKNNNTSFRSKLFSLFTKADKYNLEKLSLVFPAEATAFKSWQESANEGEWCDQVIGEYTKWEKDTVTV